MIVQSINLTELAKCDEMRGNFLVFGRNGSFGNLGLERGVVERVDSVERRGEQ
jgi:hypothetical protein